ncbi:MAG: c-type cytochrome biogenesis protein CcmI [Pseudomonadota bacterium]
MTFWVVAILITGLTVLSLLVALRRQDGAHSGASSDLQVYRDQLKEVDRDLARGVLTEAEAEVVRTEVSRRLLDADQRAREADKVAAGTAWPAALLVTAVLLGGGYWIYATLGAPGYRDLPMAQRLSEIAEIAENRMRQAEAEELASENMPPIPPPDERFTELMTQLRSVLEERPDDVRGLQLLAENEARLGNFAAAREAQDRLLEIKGDAATPADLITSIDILVFAAGGYVSPEAEEVIRRLLNLAPENGAARYYAGLTLAQNGRPDQAFPIWRRLLENGPQDAPWVSIIRQEITEIAAAAGLDYQPPGLSGPGAEAMAAADAMSEEDRQIMIEGMVEGLAGRLATEGGPAEEWARLITALGVLGQTERAAAIATEARQVFAAREDALALIDEAAGRAGITE